VVIVVWWLPLEGLGGVCSLDLAELAGGRVDGSAIILPVILDFQVPHNL
jgi:hypothetical protein